MDKQAALKAFDTQLRNTTRSSVSGGRFERDGAVIRCVGDTPEEWSGIDWADIDETTADDVIAAQVRYFAELGWEFEWKYYTHDRPADLPARLLRAGLEAEPEEALMIAAIAEVPLDIQPPEGVRLVSVTDEAGVAMVVRVHEEVFEDDHSAVGAAMLQRLESGAVVPVLAMAGDVPVSSSRIDFHDGTDFASLWGGGTVKAWRGKGIYSAMVSHRARLAVERGVSYLRVDALPTSRPILEGLGFVQLSTTVPYTFNPR